jgi:hypothetical protein
MSPKEKVAAWADSSDPTQMLQRLKSGASDRKLRLFACGCAREVWHLFDYNHRIVRLAERFADGGATEERLRLAQDEGYVKGLFHSDSVAHACVHLDAWEAARAAHAAFVLTKMAEAEDRAGMGAISPTGASLP